MTRDLPFDDASGADENDGDAAYRIANGVARVARGGAYVTGGALIAAGGSRGGSPAINHDSKNVGWSQAEDPQPNVPSPTITFPDLTADSMPQHHGPVVAPVNGVFGPLGDYRGTDAGLFPSLDAIPANEPSHAGFHGLGLPDTDTGANLTGFPTYGPRPGWGLPMDSEQPTESEPAQENPQLPSLEQPHLPGLPGFGTGLPGFGLPGSDGMHLPGMGATGLVPDHQPGLVDHSGAFDGIGAAAGQGGGVFLGTDWAFDAHIGLDGVWFHSNLKADLGVGAVGNQLDAYNQQLGQGISHIPANTTLPNNGAPATPGTATPQSAQPADKSGATTAAGVNGVPGHGVSEPTSAGAPGSGAPGSTSPVAPSGAPLASPAAPAATAPAPGLSPAAPVAPAPSNPIALTTIAPAPAAQPMPPAPAPVPPVASSPAAPVSVAPVTVQPVAVTPLQTTIQPDVANQPIANLLTTHGGPSPLTAPASVAPALFDHGRTPVLATGDSSAPGHQPTTPATKPVSAATPAPTVPQATPPTKADHGPTLTVPPIPTKIPGLDDLTKGLDTPSTIKPVTPPVNTGDTDLPTKPHTPSDDNTGTRPTVPPVTVPDDPTPHQPTVTVAPRPTAPTVPTQPSVPDHGVQPSVSVAPVPTVAPAPTMPSPITTAPHIDPPTQVKPIADQNTPGVHVQPVSAVLPVHDSVLPIQDAPLGVHDSVLAVHGAGLLVHDAGLFSGLGNAGYADAGLAAQGPGDHMLLL